MLFQGDMDRLKAAHPSLSASEIVRALVRKWLEEHGDKRVLDKVEVDV
jgi:Arc/MetJ-type ribon-helix-helix transcriptional regulator